MQKRGGVWWYDHSYQQFIRRIKGLKTYREISSLDELSHERYLELVYATIDWFVENTDREINRDNIDVLLNDIEKDVDIL